MRIINDSAETFAIDAVRPHPRNPRQGDVGAIHQSIEANGFYGAIVAQKATGHILAGNHRWQAARAAGAASVPVVWVDVDDDHALRILLADNRTNDLASYDDAALADLLRDLHERTGTLDGTGYDGDALDELLKDLGEGPDAAFGDFDAEHPVDDTFVSFRFGQYSGRVHRSVYSSFEKAYREHQKDGEVMLDDVLRGWFGAE